MNQQKLHQIAYEILCNANVLSENGTIRVDSDKLFLFFVLNKLKPHSDEASGVRSEASVSGHLAPHQQASEWTVPVVERDPHV